MNMLSIIFFILGIIIGSFLNVVVARFNTGRSLNGRSACMMCQTKLKWYDLIPLFSFLTLKGRCRTCQTKISFTYPTVEFITGLVFFSLFLKFQDILLQSVLSFAITYVFYAVVFSILIVISVYDLKHKIIPDFFSIMFGVFCFAGMFLFVNNGFIIFSPHAPSMFELLSGIFVALPFALLWLVSRGAWMGFGDAKLALGIGWLLGIRLAFSAVAMAFWGGAIIGVFLIIFSKKYGMKSEIPFAIYLALGTFFAFLYNVNLFAF